MNQCSCHYAADPNCAHCGDLSEECGSRADRLMRDPRWVSENFLEAAESLGELNVYRDFVEQDDISFCARIRNELQKRALAESEVEMRRAA